MNSQSLTTIIHLMKNNKPVYKLTIENIASYEFSFDNKKLATLSLIVSSLSVDTINMLIAQAYDCYVLMGRKKIIKDGQEFVYEIPAKAYKRMYLVDDGAKVKLFFKEIDE